MPRRAPIRRGGRGIRPTSESRRRQASSVPGPGVSAASDLGLARHVRASTPASHAGRRRPTAGPLVVLALLVLAGVGVRRACGHADPDRRPGSPAHRPQASPTPLRSVDLSSLPIARTSPATGSTRRTSDTRSAAPVDVRRATTQPGDRVALARGCATCRTSSAAPTAPRRGRGAGVGVRRSRSTAPAARADRARRARREGLPRRPADGPGFGTPTVTTSCARRAQPRRRSVTLRGLFGDAWLSCQLTLPTGRPGSRRTRPRTQRWCVRWRRRARRWAPGVERQAGAALSAPRRQRMPASRNGSISPSKTAWVLPVS